MPDFAGTAAGGAVVGVEEFQKAGGLRVIEYRVDFGDRGADPLCQTIVRRHRDFKIGRGFGDAAGIRIDVAGNGARLIGGRPGDFDRRVHRVWVSRHMGAAVAIDQDQRDVGIGSRVIAKRAVVPGHPEPGHSPREAIEMQHGASAAVVALIASLRQGERLTHNPRAVFDFKPGQISLEVALVPRAVAGGR